MGMTLERTRLLAAWFFQMLASAAWVISVIQYDSWDAGEPSNRFNTLYSTML